MTDDERPRRPSLDRREPLRSWAQMFGEPTAATDATRGPGDHGSGGSLGDAISRSVDLGYRVVDEYIRQGQRAAQRLADRGFTPDLAANDMREASERMGQFATDFFGMWLQLVEATTANGDRGSAPSTSPNVHAAGPRADTPNGPAPRAGGPGVATGPFASVSASPSAQSVGVRLEIRSEHPTEVSLDLRPEAAGRSLCVHGLRAAESDKPRLIDVDLRPASAEEPARLRIRVPSEQPIGTYSGVIIDEETNAAVGTVSVRVTRADE